MMDADKTAIGVMDDGRTQAWEGEAPAEPAAEPTQFAAQVACPVCKSPNPPSETYCMDCGFLLSSAPVAVEQAPEAPSVGMLVTPDGTREFPLKPGENTVGRENADVLLSDNTVSRKHAKITVADGRALVQDVGSSNGTRVNGQQLSQGDAVELKDGADVEFGRALLKYKAAEVTGDRLRVTGPEADAVTPESGPVGEEQPAPSPLAGEGWGEGFASPSPGGEGRGEGAASESPQSPKQEEQPTPVARLVSRDGSLSFDLFDGTSKIGRRQGDNDIVVPDPYCSGRHADLTVENGAFTITDVGSTNGTSVNGVKLEPNAPREVQPGDEIIFGQMAFTIEAAQ